MYIVHNVYYVQDDNYVSIIYYAQNINYVQSLG